MLKTSLVQENATKSSPISMQDIHRNGDLAAIHSSCGLAYIDSTGQVISANPAFFECFQIPLDSHARSLSDLAAYLNPLIVHSVQKLLTNPSVGMIELISDDQKTVNLHLAELKQVYRLVVVESLPSRKSLTQTQNNFLKNQNCLLPMKDRGMLNDILAHWKACDSHADSLAMLMIGLDRFKPINETLGHDAGDQLLNFVAQRILRVCRSDDIVVHYEGDKFVVLQINQDQPVSITKMAERLLELLKRPFLIIGQQANISASIGLAVLHHETQSVDDLTKHAELALYEAKNNARGHYIFFESSFEKKALEQHDLEVSLRRALLLQELTLFYQPQVNMSDNKVVGFEALIRWERPGKGMISPTSFIPLAESTGEIHEIGKWVLQTACREAMSWPEHITIAVNVSPVQFENNQLVSTVKAALASSGLNPQRLELEITEGLLIKNIETTLEQLWAIQAMGVSIAMDDFGTGFSSLSYLNSFPFSKIKIDQSFVHSMQTDKSRALIRAILSLGNALDMKTLAEGVETEEQSDYLALNGCMEAQGFLISKPVPFSETQQLIT